MINFWGRNLTKHSRQLRLGQTLCNASMFTEAEAERILARPLAVHVELVWSCKDLFVSISRLVGRDNALSRLDKLVKGTHVSM